MNPLWLLRTWPVRRALHAAISSSYADAPRPAPGDRVRISGLDTLRVRVIGSGLAVGYGVTTRAESIDGHLASALHAALERGVTVDDLARPDESLRDQILAAGVSGSLDLDDVVIWSPSSLEMCTSWWVPSWAARLRVLLEHVSRSKHVIVLALPLSAGSTELVAAGTAIASRINEGLERAAGAFANVSVVHPPVLAVARLGEPALTSDYYRRCADVIAGEVLLHLPGALARREP